MAHVYLDSNIVTSLIEGDPVQKGAMADRLGGLTGADGRAVITHLVRLECRVRPIATGNLAVLQDYDDWFASADVTTAALTASTYDRATHIRARRRYGLPDSLHLAAAIESGCDAFVTADAGLAGFGDIPVVLVTPA